MSPKLACHRRSLLDLVVSNSIVDSAPWMSSAQVRDALRYQVDAARICSGNTVGVSCLGARVIIDTKTNTLLVGTRLCVSHLKWCLSSCPSRSEWARNHSGRGEQCELRAVLSWTLGWDGSLMGCERTFHELTRVPLVVQLPERRHHARC